MTVKSNRFVQSTFFFGFIALSSFDLSHIILIYSLNIGKKVTAQVKKINHIITIYQFIQKKKLCVKLFDDSNNLEKNQIRFQVL